MDPSLKLGTRLRSIRPLAHLRMERRTELTGVFGRQVPPGIRGGLNEKKSRKEPSDSQERKIRRGSEGVDAFTRQSDTKKNRQTAQGGRTPKESEGGEATA